MAQADDPHTTWTRSFASKPTLADDFAVVKARWPDHYDPDFEAFTWPECINQSANGNAAFGRFGIDDCEMDDGV